MTRTAAMKAFFCLCFLGLIASAMGCTGVVIASSSYNVNDLPKSDDTDSLFFHGYVSDPGVQVRMQAKGSPSGAWNTMKTVNVATAPTYIADGSKSVEGYYWQIQYSLSELTTFRQGQSLEMWIRFINLSNGIMLVAGPRDLDTCYFDGRRDGKSPADAASACATSGEIRVAFDPPPSQPSPEPPCPPNLPNCQIPLLPDDDEPHGPREFGEGMGNGTEAP